MGVWARPSADSGLVEGSGGFWGAPQTVKIDIQDISLGNNFGAPFLWTPMLSRLAQRHNWYQSMNSELHEEVHRNSSFLFETRPAYCYCYYTSGLNLI
jgi:hypothetical protein